MAQKENDAQTYTPRTPNLAPDKGDVHFDSGAQGGQSMSLDFSTRNRVNAFQGQPAPSSDTSWPVPGEVYRPNPTPVAGPGELAPCDSSMYDGNK